MEKEIIKEVEATMKMEGMQLTEEDIMILKSYKSGKYSADEIRKIILSEV